jgi:hypothetical protein
MYVCAAILQHLRECDLAGGASLIPERRIDFMLWMRVTWAMRAAHLSRRPGQFSHLLSGAAALEMQLKGAPICATAVSVERIGEQGD